MDKLEAARHGKGVIKLEEDSAEQVKQAIERVSSILEMEDNLARFEGRRIVAGHGFALRVNCYDIFECPNGYLLHTYMDKGPNWAATGQTLEEMLAAAPDQTVARRAHGELVKQHLASIHDH